MLLKRAFVGLLLGAAITLVSPAHAEDAPASAPVYAERGELTCMRCHDAAPTTDILGTAHAVKGDSRTPFAEHGCESCHGASPEHMKSVPAGGKRAPVAVVFNGKDMSPAKVRNAACLSCHENTARMNWGGGKHDRNDVACATCHTIHAQRDPVLSKATQAQTCFKCHTEQRAESFQISHHPVREGKVACTDCHAPHGGPGIKMLKEFTVNDTCYNCHADKRGPLLWEHQPVRENCDVCHTPHGSPQARLLVERMPYLCSGCHSAAANQSGGFFGGHASLPGAAPLSATALINNELQYRSCLNCHTQVHGSNSASGAYFMR